MKMEMFCRRNLIQSVLAILVVGCSLPISSIRSDSKSKVAIVADHDLNAQGGRIFLFCDRMNQQQCDHSKIRYFVNGAPVGDGPVGLKKCESILGTTDCRTVVIVFPTTELEESPSGPPPEFFPFSDHTNESVEAIALRRGISVERMPLLHAKDRGTYLDVNGNVVDPRSE
jgi:hypothetical protein